MDVKNSVDKLYSSGWVDVFYMPNFVVAAYE